MLYEVITDAEQVVQGQVVGVGGDGLLVTIDQCGRGLGNGGGGNARGEGKAETQGQAGEQGHDRATQDP